MRLVLFATTSEIASAMPDLIDQWQADRESEGWTVRRSVYAAGATCWDVRRDWIAAPTDYVFAFGPVPVHASLASLDGHASRRTGAPGYTFQTGDLAVDTGDMIQWWQPCTSQVGFGAVFFENLPVYSQSAIELYRAYLQKRHAYSIEGAANYRHRIGVDDHFSGEGNRPEIGNYTRAELAAWGSSLDNDSGLNFDNDGGIGNDHEWDKQRVLSYLRYEYLSGGDPFESAEYYVGGADRWVADQPAVLFTGVEGSFLCDLWAANNLLRVMIAGTHTLACTYLGYGQAKLSLFLQGKPLGDVARQWFAANGPFGILSGDPTLALTADSIALQSIKDDLQGQINALRTQIATMTAPSTLPPLPPVPPAKVLLQIDCGGGASSGWTGADLPTSPSFVFTAPSLPSVAGVADAAPAVVYQTCRYTDSRPLTYTLGGFAPGRSVGLRLHFCSPHGARAETISVNGAIVESGLALPLLQPLVRTYRVLVDASGAINLSLTGTQFILSGIEVTE